MKGQLCREMGEACNMDVEGPLLEHAAQRRSFQTCRARCRTPGRSAPLGADVSPGGVNFSVYCRSAAGIELVLFDREDDALPARVLPFTITAAARRLVLFGDMDGPRLLEQHPIWASFPCPTS
jgi:hypothetical protein